MSVDTKHALRHVLCLANPSRMQAARWERPDTEQALRPVPCLPNPSRMQAARWERQDTEQALRPFLCLPNPSGHACAVRTLHRHFASHQA